MMRSPTLSTLGNGPGTGMMSPSQSRMRMGDRGRVVKPAALGQAGQVAGPSARPA